MSCLVFKLSNRLKNKTGTLPQSMGLRKCILACQASDEKDIYFVV